MKLIINNCSHEVNIIKKNNTNTYIRVKDDLSITVSTSYFTSEKQIMKMLEENILDIEKMVVKKKKQIEKESQFYLFGKKYDIIIVHTLKDIEIAGDKLYVSSMEHLEKWLKKEIIKLYQKRLDLIYPKFKENIVYPKLKIRDMKTRWGVCNRKDNSITLNKRLINYSIEKLDYVIIHELAHFVYFDHSAYFWNVVNKYCPDYKKIRKELKD